MQGIPPAMASRISLSISELELSSAACSSGYPPLSIRPSIFFGRRSSRIGENFTISAPIMRRSSRLSSYVKQNASSSATAILAPPFTDGMSGLLYSSAGAAEAIATKESISNVSSSLSASFIRSFFRDAISSGRTRPRCLLSRTMSFMLGTYPMTFTSTSDSMRSFTDPYIPLDMRFSMTPLMLLLLNSFMPLTTAATVVAAPWQSTISITGASSVCDSSYELDVRERPPRPS